MQLDHLDGLVLLDLQAPLEIVEMLVPPVLQVEQAQLGNLALPDVKDNQVHLGNLGRRDSQVHFGICHLIKFVMD